MVTHLLAAFRLNHFGASERERDRHGGSQEPRRALRMVRPRRATEAAVLLIALLASGCGLVGQGLGGGCVETKLEARGVVVDDETEPLRLSAVLTADGAPVEGAELGFFMHRKGEDGEVRVLSVGSDVTDAEGEAERVYHGGSRDISAARSEKVVGYSVEFRQIDLIDDVRYCDGRSGTAELDAPCAGFACRWGD